MSNHKKEHYLYFTFSPVSYSQEFVQLVNNTLSSYISNEVYVSEHNEVCISCIRDCLKTNDLNELLFPKWELKEDCVINGGEGFSQYLEKGKKYQFHSKITPYKTLKFEEVA